MAAASRHGTSPRGTHRCAAPSCLLDVPLKLLMCPHHWAMVPDDVARALWRAYRRAPNGGVALTKGYLDARAACVEAVRAALEARHPGDARYAPRAAIDTSTEN